MRLVLPVVLSAVGIGCAHSTSTSPIQGPATSNEVASVTPKQQRSSPDLAAAFPAPAERLIVAGPFGIREVGLDGTLVRHLSKTPAQRPRLLTGSDILFLTPEERELRIFERGTGMERTIAPLPRDFDGCPTGEMHLEDLSVQADYDFVVDEGGEAACIRLQDRNDNMMDIAVDIRVQLATGRIAYEVSFPVECSRGTPIEPCKSAVTAPRSSAKADRRRFGIQGSALVPHFQSLNTRNDVPLAPGDWQESLPSPSGHWVVVEGNLHEGDYIYRDLLLLDALKGDLYPVREGDISTPLSASQLDQLGTDAVRTVTVVGETAIKWHQSEDVLIVGSLLVIPGKSGTDLKGDVASVEVGRWCTDPGMLPADVNLSPKHVLDRPSALGR